MVKVLTLPGSRDCIRETTVELSIPAERKAPTGTSASHLAYGALVSGLAVCDGYTGAYNLLLKLEGIECTSLFNDSHIWTLATLDGTQYHIDVTWGDQYGRTDLRYFGMSEEQSYQCHPWGTADKKK